jgi:hypothetical protein
LEEKEYYEMKLKEIEKNEQIQEFGITKEQLKKVAKYTIYSHQEQYPGSFGPLFDKTVNGRIRDRAIEINNLKSTNEELKQKVKNLNISVGFAIAYTVITTTLLAVLFL